MVQIAKDGHNGIPCPDCGSKLSQRKTRRIGECLRRVRRCKNCGARFTTREAISGRIRPPVADPSAN